MKKSPVKEFIITSVAAAVAGFVVKKGYDFISEAPDKEEQEQKKLLLPDKAQETLEKSSQELHQVYEESTPAQKGLMATLVYTVTAFMVSKFLRKVIYINHVTNVVSQKRHH